MLADVGVPQTVPEAQGGGQHPVHVAPLAGHAYPQAREKCSQDPGTPTTETKQSMIFFLYLKCLSIYEKIRSPSAVGSKLRSGTANGPKFFSQEILLCVDARSAVLLGNLRHVRSTPALARKHERMQD